LTKDVKDFRVKIRKSRMEVFMKKKSLETTYIFKHFVIEENLENAYLSSS
jgi:hypothetical protein